MFTLDAASSMHVALAMGAGAWPWQAGAPTSPTSPMGNQSGAAGPRTRPKSSGNRLHPR
jgi:hypothetical protein